MAPIKVFVELTNEYPRDKSMSIISIQIPSHIAEVEQVQLLVSFATCGIDGE